MSIEIDSIATNTGLQDALALHVRNCPEQADHTIISAKPIDALISETQLRNLAYLIDRETKDGKKVTVKNAQIKDYHYEDLRDKFSSYTKDLNLAVSIIQ